MKVLKGILYFIVILAVAFLLACAFAPAEKVVERSETINAPLDKVYSQVANFERWEAWDPWYDRDTSQVREMMGTPGEPGYGYSWTSESDDVGSGTMKYSEYDGQEKIVYELYFEGMGESEGYFLFEEMNETTKVTWAYISKLPFLSRFMNYFMDGLLGPDLEKGLADLKKLVENSTDEELGIAPIGPEVTEGMVHGVNYAMVKEEIAIDEGMQDWFGKSYGAINSYCEEMGKAPVGPPCGLYYSWDMENNKTTVAAAFPLTKVEYSEGENVTLEGLGEATVRKNHIKFNLTGAYSETSFGAAHNALEKWCTDNGKTMKGPAVEEYVKGPGDQVAPEEYVTNIYYFFE